MTIKKPQGYTGPPNHNSSNSSTGQSATSSTMPGSDAPSGPSGFRNVPSQPSTDNTSSEWANDADLLARLGSSHLNHDPVDDDLLPGLISRPSILLQVCFNDGQVDEPAHYQNQDLRLYILHQDGTKFANDFINANFQDCETKPGRNVVTIRVFVPSHIAAVTWVGQQQEEHPLGVTGHALNQQGHGVYDNTVFHVAMWDERLFMQPATSYDQSSMQADHDGNFLKGMEIRYHGRDRYESFDRLVDNDLNRDQIASGRLPLAMAQAYQYSETGALRQQSEFNRRNQAAFNNAVNAANIRLGRDVRTTGMIRGIPNNMTTTQFLGFLNAELYGRFNFTYLRYDFGQQTNVGYAFVNVVHPRFLIELQEFFNNNTWPGTMRHGGLTYATIQGVEALTEKFRNSAVMLQPWDFRPHLFYVLEDGDLCANERPFPGPDNVSKMRRSEQNASEIGLFPPTLLGQPNLLDTTGRQSRFDRGSTFGMLQAFHEVQMEYIRLRHSVGRRCLNARRH